MNTTYPRDQRVAIVLPHVLPAWLAVSQNEVAGRQALWDWIEMNVPLTRLDRCWLLTTLNDIAHDLRHGQTFLLAGQARGLKDDVNNTMGRGNGYWELL